MILFDLDGVSFNFVSIFADEVKRRGLPDLDLNNHTLGLSSEEFWRVHDEAAMDGMFAKMCPHEDTLVVLRQLRNLETDFGYLTSRHCGFTGWIGAKEKIRTDTIARMSQLQFPNLDKLTFANGIQKVELVLGLKATMIVEDHAETCEDIARLTTHEGKPFVAVLLDRPWNQHSKHTPRIFHPSQLFELL